MPLGFPVHSRNSTLWLIVKSISLAKLSLILLVSLPCSPVWELRLCRPLWAKWRSTCCLSMGWVVEGLIQISQLFVLPQLNTGYGQSRCRYLVWFSKCGVFICQLVAQLVCNMGATTKFPHNGKLSWFLQSGLSYKFQWLPGGVYVYITWNISGNINRCSLSLSQLGI